MSDTERIDALENELRTLRAEVESMRRLLDNFADAIRPRQRDFGQVRLDKFDGERHG
jgi:hypothetical protein